MGLEMRVPCGRCIGCRLERSRQWAVRCMHESSCHEDNCFVTLTYSEENLPPGGSLLLADFQLFMKRFRKRISPQRVRFFHCGEYGDELGRPHYHALFFGYDFPDKYPWADRGTGPVWRSALLEELWPLGQSEIGSVSFESAAYVARYCVKKVNGKRAAAHYVDRETGLIREPEYATMSRRPGIGSKWIRRFFSDVYPEDHVISRGREAKPPRFYDEYFRSIDPDGFGDLKLDRAKARVRGEGTPDRLAVREACATARLLSSPRSFDDAAPCLHDS